MFSNTAAVALATLTILPAPVFAVPSTATRTESTAPAHCATTDAGCIVLDVQDSRGRTIIGAVTVLVRDAASAAGDLQRFEIAFSGVPVLLDRIGATRTGQVTLVVRPRSYEVETVMAIVKRGAPTRVTIVTTISAHFAQPHFPSFHQMETGARWTDLMRILRNSAIGEAQWNDFSAEQKAGLLNFYAKLQREVVDGEPIVKSVERISTFRPDRLFAAVRQDLFDRVSRATATFHSACSLLHTGERGWTMIGSFKTNDPTGNLELTFARDADGRLVADIDIDDHLGALHGWDVITHTLTGVETNPYEIHEVLLRAQALDPGYDLVPREVALSAAVAGGSRR